MGDLPIIQIFRDGEWLPAAVIEPLGDEHARVEYLPEYVFGQSDPLPIALAFPVGLEARTHDSSRPRMPAFLYDLVPQGPGRKMLADLMGLRDHEGLALPLILAGAFNPIGALRVDQAVQFHADQVERQALPGQSQRGFRLADLAERNQETVDFLTTHAMLSAGTTGVQGAAPKFLLAADADGLLYPDMALPDEHARSHWLVKGPRGTSPDDRLILINEASYLKAAAACGLDVYEPEKITLEQSWLKLPRFDRAVTEDGVQRMAQESLASLAGLQGLGLTTSLNRLLAVLRQHSYEPQQDTVEFIKRDILNQALRNTDNHARNHAVQRRLDGSIRLTPLFDFAPMFRDPELIPRALHWRNSSGRVLRDWEAILLSLDLPDDEADELSVALAGFAGTVAGLAETALEYGADQTIVTACAKSIEFQAESLSRLA